MGREKTLFLKRTCQWTLVLVMVATAAFAGQKGSVKVDAKCPQKNQGKFSITVDPLEVEVDLNEPTAWSIKTDNNEDSYIRITAKDPDKWLYKQTTVKNKKKVEMTTMVEGVKKGEVFSYEISVYCGANLEPVVLDPRVRVRGG